MARRQAQMTVRQFEAYARWADEFGAMKAKLETAFDRLAAATPAMESACMMEYRQLHEQMRRLVTEAPIR